MTKKYIKKYVDEAAKDHFFRLLDEKVKLEKDFAERIKISPKTLSGWKSTSKVPFLAAEVLKLDIEIERLIKENAELKQKLASISNLIV